MKLTASLVALLFSLTISYISMAQNECDPNLKWVNFEPQAPAGFTGQFFSDIYNDELYILGGMDTTTTELYYRILKLDSVTNSWDSITSFTADCLLNTFKIYGTEIFVGGSICSFNGDPNYDMLARYDGTQWYPVAEFMNLQASTKIYSLEIYDGNLYAAGAFKDTPSGFNGIAMYDGTNWSAMNSGLGDSGGSSSPSGIGLTVFNDTLFVGGDFSQTSPVTNENFAAWDGNNWIDVPSVQTPLIYDIYATDTCIVVTGSIINVPGTSMAQRIARYQNGTWLPMGSIGSLGAPYSFAELNNELYICGPGSSNDTKVYRNGAWEDLPDCTYNLYHRGITVYNGQLLLTSANYSCGTEINGIAYLCDTLTCGFVEGRVYRDVNADCVDNNEPGIPPAMVQINALNTNILLDSIGEFKHLVPPGNYDVSVQTPQWYNPTCQTQPQNVSITAGVSTDSVDFALEGVPNIQDLEVIATPQFARIGNPTAVYVTAKNLGTDSINATVAFTHSGLITYDSADVVLTPTGTNQFDWSIGTMAPLQTITAGFYFTTPQNINLLGQVFECTFNGSISSGTDANPSNNSDTTLQILVAAYDPNIKTGSPEGVSDGWNEGLVPPGTDEFEYTIHFQNTGLDTAYTVVIVDELDTDFDPGTFQLISSSHQVQANFIGNRILEFRFDNIVLPDSATNLIESQGFVKFKINTAPGLPIGTYITNQASIYFDFNPPIFTNWVINTIFDTSTIFIAETEGPNSSINVYPNPFSLVTTISINGMGDLKNTRALLYDMNGTLLKTLHFGGKSSIELSQNGLSKGMYILRIVDNKTVMGSRKIVVR